MSEMTTVYYRILDSLTWFSCKKKKSGCKPLSFQDPSIEG